MHPLIKISMLEMSIGLWGWLDCCALTEHLVLSKSVFGNSKRYFKTMPSLIFLITVTSFFWQKHNNDFFNKIEIETLMLR